MIYPWKKFQLAAIIMTLSLSCGFCLPALGQDRLYDCTPDTIVGLAPGDDEGAWKGATIGRIKEVTLLGKEPAGKPVIPSNIDWAFYRGGSVHEQLGTVCFGTDNLISDSEPSVHCVIPGSFDFTLSLKTHRFQLYQDGGYLTDDISKGNPLIAVGHCSRVSN